jgi:hypothetical protein
MPLGTSPCGSAYQEQGRGGRGTSRHNLESAAPRQTKQTIPCHTRGGGRRGRETRGKVVGAGWLGQAAYAGPTAARPLGHVRRSSPGYGHAPRYAGAHTRTHARTRTCMQAHTRTHQARKQMTHAHTCTNTVHNNTCIHACAHLHTLTHATADTHTHCTHEGKWWRHKELRVHIH